jgi:glycosyltransferase involved in cell wall biosynthesis
MFQLKELPKKPKIAFIHPAVGNILGGSQIFVLELAERLKNKCDITILSSGKVNDLCKPINCIPRGSVDNNFLSKKIRDIVSKFSSKPEIFIEHITAFFPVVTELIKGNYDIVFPNNDWGGLLAASIARKITGIPILFTEHNGLMEEARIAERNLKFKPDKYIAVSNEAKYWVRKYHPEIDSALILPGVDFNRFNPQVKPIELDLPRPIFLTSSRYQKNKRLELAVEAVGNLNNGSLLMLCPDKNHDYLRNLGEKILGKKRFRIVSVPYCQVPEYYRACDVFTLPSYKEPFGLVYLEAMACNKPVVATNDISRMFIIGNGGLIGDVQDIEEYARLLKLASETDFGLKPLHQAQKFSWEKCAESFYKEIIYMLKI